MAQISDHLYSETLWNIVKDEYNKEQAITDGSNFMVGNGYLGYRGTFAEERKDGYVGCFVTDTWDKADGKWEELCNVPNALYLSVHHNGTEVDFTRALQYRRELDVRHGVSCRDVTVELEAGARLRVEEEKFASMHNKHLVAMKYVLTADQTMELDVVYGIDIDVWDINGTHLHQHHWFQEESIRGVRATTFLYGDDVVVVERVDGLVPDGSPITTQRITLAAHEPYVIVKYMMVYSSNDVAEPEEEAIEALHRTLTYDEERHRHSVIWEQLWDRYDVTITGDEVAQIGYRFNTYHAIIATPTHKSLPIGARGLSCQAYQGSAFWDQEVFSLPMYLFTNPSIAKGILMYRYHTLDGARRKAKKHGYQGAFYAWISGKTGDELCPDFFFQDVITGRKIRNHFNLWQIHISPDIAYAIRKYVQVTDDEAFLLDYGLEMMLEISRFLASRVDYKPYRDRYEILRVQGPDEYHENVDNNAFTNYQTHAVLHWTLSYLTQYGDRLHSLLEKLGVTTEEIALWRDIKDKLVLPEPNDDGVIEQFDGYFDLESIVPAHLVTERLIDSEEYYGWPNGIAVFTQCLKQSDVVQLLHMHPHLFSDEVIRANYDYYEPRTLHFSSLSPSIHSILACRIKDEKRARQFFDKAISIDLKNTNEAVSGGTFIGGMHTAANAAAWLMMVQGFGGFSYEQDRLFFEPFLPSDWDDLSFRLVVHGQDLSVRITHTELSIVNHTNTKELPVTVRGERFTLHDRLILPL
jgi:kojibiose phosphorylase